MCFSLLRIKGIMTMAKKLKALLVEDDIICLKSQQRLIENQGIDVDTATSASQALSLLNDQSFDILSDHYDIIFMDILLPDIDGDRLTEFLRKEENRTTPIIAVTSHVAPDITKRFKKMGITDVIFKPMNDDVLKKMLKKYMLT